MRPETRSRGEPCERARDLMIEAIALDPGRPPEDLAKHLADCPDCRHEWQGMTAQLSTLQRLAETEALPMASADLLDRTLARLDESRALDRSEEAVFDSSVAPMSSGDARTKDLRGSDAAADDGFPTWWVRLLQHAYLAVLGIGLWVTLAWGQPAFLEGMRTFGIEFSGWLMLEYGLFVAWFVTGGLSAMVALPLLLQETLSDDSDRRDALHPGSSGGRSLLGRLGRWGTGGVRCLVWVW